MKNTDMSKIVDLSMTGDVKAQKLAEKIATLPYIELVKMLPDLHIKKGMEAPSSLVTASKGIIATHLASVAVNDGMGYLATDIDYLSIGERELYELVRLVNKEAAKNKFNMTKYSWPKDILWKAMMNGAEPLVDYYGLEKSLLSSIENSGRGAHKNIVESDILQLVPSFLRNSRFARSEIGLNFGGNHFLEIQIVDKILDTDNAAKFGLKEGKVGFMYHLGPGPLGGNILNLYEYRIKPPLYRKLGYALFRMFYQASRGWSAFKCFGLFKNWLAIDENSSHGRALGKIFSIVDNYGYAYRMGTIKAIIDALETVMNVKASDLGLKLITDISHNMLQPENSGTQRYWVSRHNCCKPVPGRPGILAGSYNCSSCITVGKSGCNMTINGYDHGIGVLLDKAIEEKSIDNDRRQLKSTRILMKPGTGMSIRTEKNLLLDDTLMLKVLEKFSAFQILEGVALLRPLMTLKMKR